jgi:putative ATPase
LAIAQVIVYLACAAKSNAVYVAVNQAMADAKAYGTLEVPLDIRNAPTRLMKDLGYGADYRYAHDEPDAFAAGASYFPKEMGEKEYYRPVPRGLEIQIGEKLQKFRELNLAARKKKK